ncbi:hypothetical protein SKAU_G00095720 [Synaphobranchus kaupii]|uniref:Uncharacterized protein n=1 Tax=Synaphobranchus kaupii TaxID=118154 RepID=A0A9Q1J6M6_SYNKA|nr:hypothetical protein SKAU_G00095720 [Synaphobranchus kaupii]
MFGCCFGSTLRQEFSYLVPQLQKALEGFPLAEPTVEKGPRSQGSAMDPELLKPVKKRKRKDYLCPSEEESEAEDGVSV